jgi:N-acetylmuramoyl-L-alanine amidase
MLILHYTALPLNETLNTFALPQSVSAHYTVDADGTIYQHVDELQAAWHAGVSFWHGPGINHRAIGIEIVNPGYLGPCDASTNPYPHTLCLGGLAWTPFEGLQIDAVAALARDIVDRYGMDLFDVLGHADVAPQRKEDPGPLFPWLALARAGVGVGYDASNGLLVHGDESFTLATSGVPGEPDVAWMQAKLADWGYAVPQSGREDFATLRVLRAFTAHYLGRIDTQVNHENMTVLETLITWRNLRHSPLWVP